MKRALLVGLGLLIAITGVAHAAGLAWHEASLSARGQAAEVNATAEVLVVSDSRAGEVWRIEPQTGAYTVYSGLTGVIDARADAAGNIWLANWSDKSLFRIDAQGAAWSWPVNALVLWGLAFDAAGRVWAADSAGVNGRVYRFDPSSRQMCSYLLPNGGAAEYLLFADGMLWAGDYANGRLVRLDPDANRATWWQVGSGGYPEGLALDSAGHVWFADYALGALGRLDPVSGELTRFTPPAGTAPAMVALVADRLWYTETAPGAVGILDPAAAAGQTAAAATGSVAVSPSCTTFGPGASTAVTVRTGTLEFAGLSPSLLADASGWTVYALPSGSRPWGIAETAGSVWVADGGRQKLLRINAVTEPDPTPTATATLHPAPHLYLPLIRR
jgi:streptogramin lyase